MERIYKIETVYSDEVISHYALCVSADIATMPFNVWRDVSRYSYHSISFSARWSMFKFVTDAAARNAASTLEGALFREVNRDEWVLYGFLYIEKTN